MLLVPVSQIQSMSRPTKPYLIFLKAYSQHRQTPDEIVDLYQSATTNPENKEAIDKLVLGEHFGDMRNDYLEALLKTKKINPNTYRFGDNYTALMWVVFCQYPVKTYLLLLHGAAIEEQDCKGETAMDKLNSKNSINRGPEIKEQIQKMLQEAQEKAQPRLLKKELEKIEINRLSSYLTSHPYTLETVLLHLKK